MDSDAAIRILVVDDEAAARTALAELLRDEGYIADTAGDAFKALARAEEQRPDLVLTDLRMPSMDGVELIRRLRRADIDVPVVVMTAYGSIDAAREAMLHGAVDFVVKPLDTSVLFGVIERSISNRKPLTKEEDAPTELPGLVVQSHEMREVARLIRQAARARANVFLRGEAGTGKARIAKALHELSRNSQGPFIVLSCEKLARDHAADPEACREQVRRAAEAARGGTLYLPSIATLPWPAQAALLDVLPSSAAEPQIRVVSAGARDLRFAVQDGTFREDLGRLLSVVEVPIPSLRQRSDDLILLARSLLGPKGPGLSAEVVSRLRRYDWPGNIPELAQVLSQAQAQTHSGVIRAEHLSLPARKDHRRPTIPGATLEDIERFAILQTLEAQGGSTSRAARVLGISVRKIQYKLHEYGVTRSHVDGSAVGE